MEETEGDQVDSRDDTDIGIDCETQINASSGATFKSKVSTCKA